MSVSIQIGEENKEELLTAEELKRNELYLSTMFGSSGWVYSKLGDTGKDSQRVFAFKGNSIMLASTAHKRDFYPAPIGTRVIIRKD